MAGLQEVWSSFIEEAHAANGKALPHPNHTKLATEFFQGLGIRRPTLPKDFSAEISDRIPDMFASGLKAVVIQTFNAMKADFGKHTSMLAALDIVQAPVVVIDSDDDAVEVVGVIDRSDLALANAAPGIHDGGALKVFSKPAPQKRPQGPQHQKEPKQETIAMKICSVHEVQAAFELQLTESGAFALTAANRYEQVFVNCIGKSKRLDKASDWARQMVQEDWGD